MSHVLEEKQRRKKKGKKKKNNFWRTSCVDIQSNDVSQYVPLCNCHVRETAKVGCADGDNFHPSEKGLSQSSGNSAAQ
jgi:hypothetical protein